MPLNIETENRKLLEQLFQWKEAVFLREVSAFKIMPFKWKTTANVVSSILTECSGYIALCQTKLSFVNI